MASFSVDITNIKFASDRTSYQDVTITNAPAGGITVVTTAGATYFRTSIITSGSKYRIETKTTNTSTSTTRTGTVQFRNSNDSTDYVSVSLYQLPDTLSLVESGTNSKKINTGFGNASSIKVYADYNTQYASGEGFYVYVNKYSTPTVNGNWIHISDLAEEYSTTGFRVLTIYLDTNYNEYRSGKIEFNPGLVSGNIYISQNAYPSPTSGCTSPLEFYVDGGTKVATIKTTSSELDIEIPLDYNIPITSVDISQGGQGEWLCTVAVSQNTSGKELRGTLVYDYYNGSSFIPVGHTNIIQYASASTDTLSVNPSVMDFTSVGETHYATVSYAAPLSTNASSAPSWVSVSSVSSTLYAVTVSTNTSLSRSWNWELTDANMSLAVPVNQAAPGPTIIIYPTDKRVDSYFGGFNVTVTTTGLSDVSYSTLPGWIDFVQRTVNDNVYTYSFTYDQNQTSSERTATITFYGDGVSASFTLTQAANVEPSMVVTPSTQSVSPSSGSVTVNVSSNNINTITYSISDNWVTFISEVGNTYTFAYTSNTGSSSRTATVTFTGTSSVGTITKTYTITQTSVVYLNISPTSSIQNGDISTVSIKLSTNIDNVTYNISDTSWIQYYDYSSGSNTYRFRISANSGSSSRTGTITFSGGGISQVYTVTQLKSGEGYLNVHPGPYRYNSQDINTSIGWPGGTFDVIVDTNLAPVTYTIGDDDIQFVSKTDNVYKFRCLANTSSLNLDTHSIYFYAGGLNTTFTILQFNTSDSYIDITPDYAIVGSSAGTVSITTSGTASRIEVFDDSDWIDLTSSSNPYTFSYTANTTSSRRYGRISFRCSTADGKFRRVYTLVQEAGGIPVLVIDPTSDVVDYHTRAVRVTVYTENIDTVTYNIQDASWLHFSSIPSPGQYSFIVDENTGTSLRTNTVTFTGGGLSRTYTLTQTGRIPTSPGLKASPTSLRYYSTSSRQTVSFNMPVDEVTYSITYVTSEGQDWLSTSIVQNGINFTAQENVGSKRSATIRFYEIANPSNYVDVPVIQGSGELYYDSIWVDNMYIPLQRSSDNTYYYRLVDSTTLEDLYTGMAAIPDNVTDKGIDIPRLIEGHLNSIFDEEESISDDWFGMPSSYKTVNLYNMTSEGYPGTLESTFRFYNDWSGTNRRYDYTRYTNDPINGKGCDGMIIPVCVYFDSNEGSEFSIIQTMAGTGDTNTYNLSDPDYPFAMLYHQWYSTKTLDYKSFGDTIFSYDMTHCGKGALVYKNRFGGFDSFLIEGNISRTDNYTKQNYSKKGIYNGTGYRRAEKNTVSVDIDATYEAYTGWLTDDEAERLVFHLLSSPKVYYQDIEKGSSDLIPVRITNSAAEYKKFRNGKRLVNYLITFEKANTEKVMD